MFRGFAHPAQIDGGGEAVPFSRTYTLTAEKTGGGPGSGTATSVGYGASMELAYQYGYNAPLQVGLKFDCGATENADGSGERTYSIRFKTGDPINRLRSGSGQPSAKVVVSGNLLWLEAEGVWRLDTGTADWYIEGILEGSYPLLGTGGETAPIRYAPSNVPIFGCPPLLTSNSTVLYASPTWFGQPAQDPPPPFESSSGSISSLATGGWTETVGGDVRDFPFSCPSSAVTGDHCSQVQVGSSHTVSVVYGQTTYQQVSGKVDLIPGGACELVRMEDDYGALVLRSAMPGFPLLDQTNTTTSIFPRGGGTTITGGTTPFLPALSTLLQEVGQNKAAIEEALTGVIHAPYEIVTVDYDETRTQTTNATRTQSFGKEVTSYPGTGANAVPQFLRSLDARALYVNFRGSPLFSYGLPILAGWKVDGGPPEPGTYFEVNRQQHGASTGLPGGGTKRRYDVVAEPYTQNQLYAANRDNGIGVACGWGITRFELLDAVSDAWPDSRPTTAASAPRVRYKDGAGLGSGTTLAGGYRLETGDAIEIDLLDSGNPPYLFPGSCDRVELPSLGSNVAKVVLVLVGSDVYTDEDGAHGPSKKKMGEGPGVHRFPAGASLGSAVSSTIAFGGQDATEDTYQGIAQTPPVPDLSGLFRHPLRSQALGLLPTRTGFRLRLEVTRTNPDLPATVPHVIFRATPAADQAMFRPVARWAHTPAANGPLAIYGAQDWFDYALDVRLSSPAPTTFVEYTTTVGDAITHAGTTHKGIPALDPSDEARLGRFFVRYPQGGEEPAPGAYPYEWISFEHAFRDPYNQALTTHSFKLFGGTGAARRMMFALVNSNREAPPMAMFPRRKRLESSYWRETGEWGQFAYSLCKRAKPVLVPGNAPPSLKALGVEKLTAGTAPLGWRVGWLDLATTGDESYDYTLAVGSRSWLKVRPFRGLTFVPTVAEMIRKRRGGVHSLATFDGRFAVGFAGEDGARVRTWDGPVPIGSSDASVEVASGEGYFSARVAQDTRLTMIVDLSRETETGIEGSTARSNDSGRTWSPPETMPIDNAAYPLTVAGHGPELVTIAFVPDDPEDPESAGVLRGYFRATPDADPGAVRTLALEGGSALRVEGLAFGHQAAREGAGRWIVTAVPEGETEERSWYAADVASDFTLTPL